MKFSKITFSVISLGLYLSCHSAIAGDERSLNGCYDAVRGHVETSSFSQEQQLGQYRIVLKHNNWNALSEDEQSSTIRRHVIKGQILGSITNVDESGKAYLNHVMSDKRRSGLLFSQNDEFTPLAAPEFCNESGGYILSGIEKVSIVNGSGFYSGLSPAMSTFIEVTGTINSCTGNNDFEVVSGTLCFSN